MKADLFNTKKYVLATFILLFAWFTTAKPSLAQNKREDNAVANQIISFLSPKKIAADRTLEERARQIVAQQLDNDQFLITVETQLDPAKLKEGLGERGEIRLRTLPKTLKSKELARAFAETVTAESVITYYRNIRINLIVDEKVSRNLEPLITRALISGLSLQVERGDRVTIGRDKLNALSSTRLRDQLETATRDSQAKQEEARKKEEEARRLQIDLKAIESQKVQLETQRTQLEAQKNDAQQKLQTALSENETLKKKLSELEGIVNDDKTGLGKLKKFIRGMELPATIVPLGFLFLIVVVVFGFVLVSSANRKTQSLSAGLQSLAGALERAGVANAKNQNSGFGAIPTTTTQAPQALEGNTPNLLPPAEEIDISRREAEAAWLLMQKHPYPMLSTLKDWLNEEQDREKFIAFSDAIGVENARTLWAKFPRTEIEGLNQSMFKPVSKQTAYATVTQLYRYVTYELAGKPKFFENLELEFLASLTNEELATVLSQCELETAACCFLFVSPKRAAALYETVQNHSPRDLMNTLGKLSAITEQDATRHVEMLRREAENVAPKNGFDLSSHIAVLLQASSSGEKKQAISAILENDDKLSAEVRSRVVTFDDVMQLERETLSELIAPLEPEQVAALFLTVSGEYANNLASLLSQKFVVAVQQEYNRTNRSPTQKRKAVVVGNKIQAAIISRVKQLASEGLVVLPNNPSKQRQEEETDETLDLEDTG